MTKKISLALLAMLLMAGIGHAQSAPCPLENSKMEDVCLYALTALDSTTTSVTFNLPAQTSMFSHSITYSPRGSMSGVTVTISTDAGAGLTTYSTSTTTTMTTQTLTGAYVRIRVTISGATTSTGPIDVYYSGNSAVAQRMKPSSTYAGAANQVAFFTDAYTIGSNPNITINPSTGALTGTTGTFNSGGLNISATIPGATVTGTGTSQVMGLPGRISIGSQTSLGIFFAGTNTGIGYNAGGDQIVLNSGNADVIAIGAAQFRIQNTYKLGWTIAGPTGGGADTALSRISAGIVGVGDGSTTDNVASLGNLTNRLTGLGIIGLHSGATAMTFSTSSGDAVAVTLSTAQLVRFNAYGTGTLQTDGSGNITAVSGLSPVLSGTSASLGGGALLAGACASNTTTVTGATTGMAVIVDPATYPGDGAYWDGYVSSTNNVVTKVCATVALTPGASAYNIRVIQ